MTTGDRGGAYDWEAADRAGTPWAEWNPEQQAECVQDYNHLLRQQRAGDPPMTPADTAKLGRARKYIPRTCRPGRPRTRQRPPRSERLRRGPQRMNGPGSS